MPGEAPRNVDPDLAWMIAQRQARARQTRRIVVAVVAGIVVLALIALAPGWMLSHGARSAEECVIDHERSPRRGVAACLDQGIWFAIPRRVPWTRERATAVEAKLRRRAARIGLETATRADPNAADRSRFVDEVVALTPRPADLAGLAALLEDRGAYEDLARIAPSLVDGCSLGRAVRAQLRLGLVGDAVATARRVGKAARSTLCAEGVHAAAVALCLGPRPAEALALFDLRDELPGRGAKVPDAAATERLCRAFADGTDLAEEADEADLAAPLDESGMAPRRDGVACPAEVRAGLERAAAELDAGRLAEAGKAATAADEAAARLGGDAGRASCGTAALETAIAIFLEADAEPDLGEPGEVQQPSAERPELADVAAWWRLVDADEAAWRAARSESGRLVPPWDAAGLYALLGAFAGEGNDVEAWLDHAVDASRDGARQTARARAAAARWRGDAGAERKWLDRLAALEKPAGDGGRARVMRLEEL